MRLVAGDLLWEVAGEKYFTQFNEKTDRQLRVHPPALQPLESASLIHLRHHPAADHKLDFWDITDQGRAALAESAPLPRKSPTTERGARQEVGRREP
jgi:hypothetical protein